MNEHLSFAKTVAEEAGAIMRAYFQLGVDFTLKEDESVVTKADKKINQLVIDRVAEKYPDHSVLGEESSMDKQSTFVWVCDPIDGTLPFVKGLPISVFSLALLEEGVSVLGVVYDPYNNRLYSAIKGQGAFVNDTPIKVSARESGNQVTVNVEWWPEAVYDIDTATHHFSKDSHAYVLHLGSVVHAACLVAAGQYEGCVFAGTKEKNVDMAAVKVIVEEAGGKVTNLFGDEERYDKPEIKGAIISNGVMHERLISYTKNL